MTDTAKAYVQVALDGTGKKIRNLVVTEVVDGVSVTTYVQNTYLSDGDGRPLRPLDQLLEALATEQARTNALLQTLIEIFG